MIASTLFALIAIVPALASPLLGAWAAVQTFGHAISGGSVRVVIAHTRITATIGNHTASATASK